MPRVRILVLTSSTGGGHDARAEAFAEWCFQLYRHEVDVRIENMLEKSSVVGRSGVNFYNYIQKKSPWIHTAFYAVVELLGFINRRTVSFGRDYYIKVLNEYKPHLIFSVHDCLNRGYFPLARKILAPKEVRCATYSGEFSGGWGYSWNWVEPSADLYFSRTRTANDFAVKIGMPREHTRVRGHLMQPGAYLEIFNPHERLHFREKKLGLRPDLFTVFLATGGNGANNHLELLPELLPYADKVQAIVICGKNLETYHELLHWRATHPELNCYIEGYSEIVPLLMQASDTIVTRGGTTTCAKALLFQCPIIFNAFGGIMPQESLTVKYFRNGGGAGYVEKASDFRQLIEQWMNDPSSYQTLRDNFLKLRYDDNPVVLIDELVGLAQDAAGVKLKRRPWPPSNGNGKKA
ncbi:MAG TPA: glycosyltransferase [Opitutaceae bacterium]|nr:glycosyltransferase [Opitutaceae bacterium]